MPGSSDSPRASDVRSSDGPSHSPSLALSPARSQRGPPVGEGLFLSSCYWRSLFGTYAGLPLWSLSRVLTRRWHSISPSSSSGPPNSPPLPPAPDLDSSGLHFLREPSRRRIILIPDAAGLVASGRDLLLNSSMDFFGHQPFCEVAAHSLRGAMLRKRRLWTHSLSHGTFAWPTRFLPYSSRHSADCGLLWRLPPRDPLLASPEIVSGGPGSPGHRCLLVSPERPPIL